MSENGLPIIKLKACSLGGNAGSLVEILRRGPEKVSKLQTGIQPSVKKTLLRPEVGLVLGMDDEVAPGKPALIISIQLPDPDAEHTEEHPGVEGQYREPAQRAGEIIKRTSIKG